MSNTYHLWRHFQMYLAFGQVGVLIFLSIIHTRIGSTIDAKVEGHRDCDLTPRSFAPRNCFHGSHHTRICEGPRPFTMFSKLLSCNRRVASWSISPRMLIARTCSIGLSWLRCVCSEVCRSCKIAHNCRGCDVHFIFAYTTLSWPKSHWKWYQSSSITFPCLSLTSTLIYFYVL